MQTRTLSRECKARTAKQQLPRGRQCWGNVGGSSKGAEPHGPNVTRRLRRGRRPALIQAVPGHSPSPRVLIRRRLFASQVLALFGALVAFPAVALGQTAFTVPALPFNIPYLPSPSLDWTVKIGVDGTMTPSFYGSKNFTFSPSPIFSIQRAGSPEQFTSSWDNPSIALLDFGRFRLGPVGKFVAARNASSDNALRGLRKVSAAVELGAFAEYYPVDWFRTRLEVRNGFGGHKGVAGDLSADAIIPLDQGFTFSAGPRLSLKNAQAVSPYFDINTAESLASGLPAFRVKGTTTSAGAGAQLGYMLTSQWEVHANLEYERLFNGAAKSPLVKSRGSPDQLTFGLGLSYSFDVKVK